MIGSVILGLNGYLQKISLGFGAVSAIHQELSAMVAPAFDTAGVNVERVGS